MRLEAAAAALMALQAALVGAPWPWVAAGALLVGAGWRWAPLRHGLGSVLLGGLGMIAGAALDRAVGVVPACHGGPMFGFATLGMVLGCTLACVLVCASAGRPRFDVIFHGVVLAGMWTGEEAAVALATVSGLAAGHWTMVLGMGAGAAVGALAAGLLRPADGAGLRGLREAADG